MYSYKKLSVQQEATQKAFSRLPQHVKNFARVRWSARGTCRTAHSDVHPPKTLAQSSGDVRAKIRSRTSNPLSHSAFVVVAKPSACAENFSQRGASDTESWQARGLPPLRICSPRNARARERATCQDEGQQRQLNTHLLSPSISRNAACSPLPPLTDTSKNKRHSIYLSFQRAHKLALSLARSLSRRPPPSHHHPQTHTHTTATTDTPQLL